MLNHHDGTKTRRKYKIHRRDAESAEEVIGRKRGLDHGLHGWEERGRGLSVGFVTGCEEEFRFSDRSTPYGSAGASPCLCAEAQSEFPTR
jgi:hypothetical protein